MNVMKSNSLKLAPKYVLLVTTIALFTACASKEMKNASLEPLDLPAEDSVAHEPMPAPAPVQKAKKTKSALIKKKKIKKHAALPKQEKPVAAAGTLQTVQLPSIGDGTVASAPIQVPPMAPPVPFEMGIENNHQPNWWLAAFIVGGVVALLGIAFRVRKAKFGKRRRLVYNS